MIGRFRPPEVREQAEEPKGFDDFEVRLGDVMRGERATMGKSLLDVQRELKIKASYIAAIENADPTAIETPGFVAGYVRSYSRYLGLDPEWAFRAFCAEANFETASSMASQPLVRRDTSRVVDADRSDIFANSMLNFAPRRGEALLSKVEPGAIGSTAVLFALIGLIGYGGFSVLKEVQKVDVVPVDRTPELSATLDPLSDAVAPPPATDEVAGVAPRDSEALDRLYRPQALEVPVMIARDGPIAALDPSAVGALAPATLPRGDVTPQLAEAPAALQPSDSADPALAALVAAAQSRAQTPQVVENGKSLVSVVAVREAWVRVRAADGTTLLSRTMQPGETFALPKTETPADFRTGNAGGVYFSVDGQIYGPAGGNGSILNVASLAPEALTQDYRTAELGSDQALCEVMIAAVEAPDPALLACRN